MNDEGRQGRQGRRINERVSAKTEYAFLAMLELACRYSSGEPVRIRKIAADQDISWRFLVQILLQLKGAGLVTSTRGTSGGYQLARRPEEITLWEVITTIEGTQEAAACESEGGESAAATVLNHLWRQVAQAQQVILAKLTLADLVEQVEQVEGESQHMYYI